MTARRGTSDVLVTKEEITSSARQRAGNVIMIGGADLCRPVYPNTYAVGMSNPASRPSTAT
jgi:hypothetical protein